MKTPFYLLYSVLCLISLFVFPKMAVCQVSGDGSLKTNVTSSDGLNFNINDGSRAGNNLYHSFKEFSIPSNGSAIFNNSSDIINIINRVTGGKVSDINGLIKTTGNANLFLINPQGIVFSKDAQLDIGGSFIGSTADRINFADGSSLSAIVQDTLPLLTISAPIGLQYGENPGNITVAGTGGITNGARGIGLQVPFGKTLALIGGNIFLPGGDLVAQGGRVELGSVGSNSNVSLNNKEDSWELGYEGVEIFKDIESYQGASIDVSGPKQGTIQLQGNSIALQEGTTLLGFNTSVNSLPAAGNIIIQARDTLELKGSSTLGFPNLVSTRVRAGSGTDAGDISIKTRRLLLNDGATILSSAAGNGSAGNINIDAHESVELNGGNRFGAGSAISTQVIRGATGNAGELTVETGKLILNDGAQITSTTRGNGNGGNLTLRASEFIEIAGFAGDGLSSRIFSQVNSGGKGDAGNLTIETSKLILRDGARVGSGTFGEGNGSDLKINARESVELSGVDIEGFGSVIASQVNSVATGNAGNLTIETRRLNLNDGAVISSATDGNGNSGDLTVQASELIKVENNSAITASTAGGGNPGNLNVITDNLRISNGGELLVRAQGEWSAGSLTINANSIFLDNQASLNAETAAGEQGNISLESQNIILRRNSEITTNATGNATGGSITIDSEILALLENSKIVAQALEGPGGNINITTEGLFQLPGTRIDASSQLGIDGVIAIDAPDTDPSQQITELPEGIIDTDNLVATSCLVPSNRSRGKFIITGVGGLANVPDGVSISRFATYSVPKNHRDQLSNSEKVSSLIIESSGIFTLEDGSVVLGRRCEGMGNG